MLLDQWALQMPEPTGITIAMHHEGNGIGPRDRDIPHHAAHDGLTRLHLALLHSPTDLRELEQGVVGAKLDAQRTGRGLLHVVRELGEVLRVK
ncbi:hypothetical protein D9M69_630200 [compost metagenome]